MNNGLLASIRRRNELEYTGNTRGSIITIPTPYLRAPLSHMYIPFSLSPGLPMQMAQNAHQHPSSPRMLPRSAQVPPIPLAE